jgi:hypothetical protein
LPKLSFARELGDQMRTRGGHSRQGWSANRTSPPRSSARVASDG